MVLGVRELSGQSGHEAGRALLEELYCGQTGENLPQIDILPQGKPVFKDRKWHFSITHTKRRAFCVLADKPVGIDAEEQDRTVDLRLADRILSETERRRYEAAADKRIALLRLWVLKEAYAKLTGRGWGSYLYKTDFDPEDPRIQEINGCFVAVIE